MLTLDKEQGLAQDVGEIWGPNDEVASTVLVNMAITDDANAIEFCFGYDGANLLLAVPLDRLSKLVRKHGS